MNACSLLMLLVFFPAVDPPASDDASKELARFDGTWRLISAETDGQKTPEVQVKLIKVVIKNGKHSVYRGDELVSNEVKFTVDPTKKPKTSDDTLPDGRIIRGIYELDGDTLRSCVAPVGKERPAEFTARQGTGLTLRVFRREK